MSEQVRRFMAPTNDTCDMDSYQQVVLAADHDAAVQALRADAREWKAKSEEALKDWRKACQLNGDAAEREFKLKAEAEALRAETGRLAESAKTWGANCARAVQGGRQLRTELEAARGLLGMMASALYEERNEHEDTPAHILNATNAYEMWMAVTPAPEALAEQGERQEVIKMQHMAVAEDGVLRWMTGRKIENCELYAMPDFGRAPGVLYTTPQPGPDVRGLAEALEHARLFIRNGVELGYIKMPDADTPDPAHETLPKIEAALAAHRQAQQGGSHDT